MKKLTLIVLSLVITVLVAAQLNYLAAIQDAKQSIGTDSAIESAMYLHGYNVDAMDCSPVSFSQKITALINIK